MAWKGGIYLMQVKKYLVCTSNKKLAVQISFYKLLKLMLLQADTTIKI